MILEEKIKRLVNVCDKYYDDRYKICIENNIDINKYDYVSIPSITINYIPVRFKSIGNDNKFTIIYLPYKYYVDEKILSENNEKVIFSYRKSRPLTLAHEVTNTIVTTWN